MKVPFIVRFPEKYRHLAPAAPGESRDRLVSFIDLPPTLLSLLGLEVPGYMQGSPFLGPKEAAPRTHVHGARDRIDEAYDLARSVRSHDYLYIRTYLPHLSYNQPSFYSDQAEIRQEINRLAAIGGLSGPQLAYAGPRRPLEELYAVREDPQQLRNLAEDPAHQEPLRELRARLSAWQRETRDVGFLPEADAWTRLRGDSPFEMASSSERYPQREIVATAALVGRDGVAEDQVALLSDPDAAVRYWAAVGLTAKPSSAKPSIDALSQALSDGSPVVRIAAAGALAAAGHVDEALETLTTELKGQDPDAALLACRTIELLGPRAGTAEPAMRTAAARYADLQTDQALFIRFSTTAFFRALE
jgi:hypothetical protein